MQRRMVVALAILALSVSGIAGCKKQEKQAEGPGNAPPPAAAPAAPPQGAPSSAKGAAKAGASAEQLYKQYCVACHPDGGNTINPKKTLHHADMAANKVTTADDVVKLMRNPGPGMSKFDASMISDDDAKAIGKYVIDTFK